IRDFHVTGVQTCALPICAAEEAYAHRSDRKAVAAAAREVVVTAEEARVMAIKQKAEEDAQAKIAADKKAAEEREAKARAEAAARSEERRVGKEGSAGGGR